MFRSGFGRGLVAASVLCLLAGLAGCNVLQTLGGSTTMTNFAGNYAFAEVPGTTGQTAGPVLGFVGGIANSGSTFTATFRLVTSGGCASPAANLNFTGTRAASGEIDLTSTTLPANPVTIVWYDDPNQSSNGVGTYTISGNGPCAMSATKFVSDQFSPVTGTYTGSFTTGNGVQATVRAALTQGAANSDGQFPETGTLVLSTPTCTNNFTVSGVVTGPAMTVAFNPASGASLGGFVAVLPDHVLTLTIPAGISVSGSCNAGTFSGVLTRQ